VTYQETRNIYQYDSRNLIISYSTAIFFALFSVSVGLSSFRENGVAHSTAFSAIVATTRNSELDILSKGHSLGAVPLEKLVAEAKLRFGELVNGSEKDIRNGEEVTEGWVWV